MSRETIIDGMATILWGSAWADHAEERQCVNLSGCEITEVMPDVPKEAREHAERIALTYEKMNECSLEALYQRAVGADERAGLRGLRVAREDGPERFGECLAWEAMGAGVGWEDDHAEYVHEVPHDAGVASCDLMYLAETTCEECITKRRKYTVLSLDMWGHVPADCHKHGCPCMLTKDERGPYHDDDACECHEDCNNQHKVGTIETRDDEDKTILDALHDAEFLSAEGREKCEIDDYTDGTMLDVNDDDGRRIFALQLEGEEP